MALDPCRFYLADIPETALRALEAWAAGTAAVTRATGLSGRPSGGVRAAIGGPHCERIFGPLLPDRCACGRLDGPAHRGEVCVRCGVTPGDPSVRATRWAHVACEAGVPHPALQGGRVHHLPISPPAGRVAPPLPRGLLPTPTVEDLLLAKLVGACGRLDLLTRYGAPEVIVTDAEERAAALVRSLGDAAGASRERPIFEGPGADGPRLVGRAPPRGPRAAPVPQVDGLAFWGEHLVSTGRAGLRVTSLRTGRGRCIPAGRCSVRGVVGDVAVFDGQLLRGPRFAAADGYAALDLATGRWQDALPGAPRIVFGKDQPEDAWAVELATGRIAPLDVGSDRPAFGAYTPALDALLVLGDDDDGLVLDGDTGLTLLDLSIFPDDPVRVEAGRRIVPRDGRSTRGGPPALVHLGGRRWRVLLPSGAVGEVDEGGATVRWALRSPHSAAAFSPDGARLAVACGRRVRVLDANGSLLRTIVIG